MRKFFIFDVESIGLHGEAFAVAGGLYLENGASQWEFCFSCPPDAAEGSDEDRKWIALNVPLLDITHRGPTAVRHAFWDQWMKARAEGAVAAVECGWPVEAGLLFSCIHDDLDGRRWNGPYPLHEIASFMEAAGMDPMVKYERNAMELPPHNPLSDVRLSVRLLAEALERIAKMTVASEVQ